jgi:hypothetical protein
MTQPCPICKISSDTGFAGDGLQVRCPRCGPFVITGTARAMLGSRLEEDPKAFARLSHAVRTDTAETRWLRIDSTNLDELVQRRLPSIEGQIDNFLSWIANQVGDDQLEPVEIAEDADLSGVIGMVNMARFGDLRSHVLADGLIALVGGECVRLTPKGWSRLAKASPSDPPPVTRPVASDGVQIPYPIETCECPECGRARRAERMRGLWVHSRVPPHLSHNPLK